MRFFVQTAAGYSDLAAAEAQDAGAQHIQIVPGGIQFEGDHAAGYRFTLWTRISSRVLLELEPVSAQRKPLKSVTRTVSTTPLLRSPGQIILG